jgi:hypothetical protein
MAQRRKVRAAQRGKAAKRPSTRSRAAAAKATKRQPAKAKTKTKRIVAKPIAPKMVARRKEPKELPIEVVRVGQVNEPAPGVVVVSDYESVQVGPIPVTAVPDKSK